VRQLILLNSEFDLIASGLHDGVKLVDYVQVLAENSSTSGTGLNSRFELIDLKAKDLGVDAEK
jgi:hypothetical protein